MCIWINVNALFFYFIISSIPHCVCFVFVYKPIYRFADITDWYRPITDTVYPYLCVLQHALTLKLFFKAVKKACNVDLRLCDYVVEVQGSQRYWPTLLWRSCGSCPVKVGSHTPQWACESQSLSGHSVYWAQWSSHDLKTESAGSLHALY